MTSTNNWQTPRSAISINFNGLLEKLTSQHGFTDLDAAQVESFVAQAGNCVLLLVDDPDRVPESWDLAVIMPTLLGTAKTNVHAGIVRSAHVATVQRKYAINRLPTLLFLRDNQYVGTIEGLRDWNEYVVLLNEMLQRPTTRAPGIGIPVASANVSCH